ncbi:hypothetical protein KQX54_007565 [Cotesia glomerata]|uniref:Sugar transporter SWEET1 n=1 Tax=Cotesia glomerata TaxID=32391 RepID=A0AAV7ILV8_COTGL|nr:hypothetical protein KQX54_007565 [Cotesia glomerata]
MFSEAFKGFLATSASICTVLQFLAGTLVCRKYIINGTTGDTSGFAFVTCLISQFLSAVLFIAIVYSWSIVEEDKSLATEHVGILSCGFTILFFASPLTMLAHVIKHKSADSLPFPVIISSLVVSCQWFAYGSLIGDPYIQLPNFLGCVLSTFQLSLFVIFPSKKNGEVRLV